MCSNFFVIILVVTTAVVILLELVLGGYLLIAHLMSFSIRFLFLADLSNLWIVLVFVLIISINLFSIGVLLLALLSGYFEKCFSYEIFGLISLSFIICMSAQKLQTGHDLYEEVIVKEIYQDHMRAYHPLQDCHFKTECTEAANFHRIKKCCGWERPQDFFDSEWNVQNNDKQYLPKYCCNVWYMNYKSNNCTIDSKERFTKGCRSSMIDEYETFSPISYRYGIAYPILKAISLILFRICKTSSVLPRAEGIFSHSIPK